MMAVQSSPWFLLCGRGQRWVMHRPSRVPSLGSQICHMLCIDLVPGGRIISQSGRRMQENTGSSVRFLLLPRFTLIPNVCAIVGPKIRRDEMRTVSQKSKVKVSESTEWFCQSTVLSDVRRSWSFGLLWWTRRFTPLLWFPDSMVHYTPGRWLNANGSVLHGRQEKNHVHSLLWNRWFN